MKGLHTVGNVLKKFAGVTGLVTQIGICFVILLTTADVILRYTLNKPILGSMELCQYAMLIAVFASFSFGQTEKSHIHVTLLLTKFSRRVKYIVFSFLNIMGVVVIAAASIAAGQQAQIASTRGYISATLEFPTAPFLWAECVLLAFFALAALYDTVLSIIAIFNDEAAEEVKKDWT